MGKVLNIDEAFVILKKHYVTQEIQMVSRYLRQKRLKGEKTSNKGGWEINEEDLYDFIDTEIPGIVQVMHVYEQHLNNLHVDSSPEEYLKKGSIQDFEKLKMMFPFLSAMIKTTVPESQFPDSDDKDDTIINQMKGLIDKEIKEAMTQVYDSINKLTQAITELNLNKQKTSVVSGDQSDFKSESKREKGPHSIKKFADFKSLLKKWGLIPEKDTDVTESDEQISQWIYSVYYDEEEQLRQAAMVVDGGLLKYACPHTNEKHKHFKYLIKKVFPVLKEEFKKTIAVPNPSPQSGNQQEEPHPPDFKDGEEQI